MANRRRIIVTSAVALGDRLLRSILFDGSSAESENDDSDGVEELELRRRIQLRGRQHKPARNGGYVDDTVPRYTHTQFRQYFRMTPEDFEKLENILGPVLSQSRGKPVVAVRKELLGTLWLLATPDSYRSVGDRFDIAKSSLSSSFMHVVTALNDIASDIKWPTNEELERVKSDFNRYSPLHGIIGAIDGTHIQIKAPRVNRKFYKTYKKMFAITLQAVCDSRMKFTDCFAGLGGPIGDLRVLGNSDLMA